MNLESSFLVLLAFIAVKGEIRGRPLESLDFPFYSESPYVLHEDIQNVEDITNKSEIYSSFLQKILPLLSLGNNEFETSKELVSEILRVRYVGLKSEAHLYSLFVRFDFKSIFNRKGSCDVYLSSRLKDFETLEVTNHRCLLTTELLECFVLKNGVKFLNKEDLYKENEKELENRLKVVNCALSYGRREQGYHCFIDIEIKSHGKEVISGLGCKTPEKSLPSHSNCLQYTEKFFNCTCSESRCNHPASQVDKIYNPILFNIQILLKEMSQRIDEQFETLLQRLSMPHNDTCS